MVDFYSFEGLEPDDIENIPFPQQNPRVENGVELR